MLIGCHLSIAKGFEAATQTAVQIKADTFQFFTRNPRGSRARALDLNDIQKMQIIREKKKFGPLLAHAPYTLNPCALDPKTREFAALVFAEDAALMRHLPNCLYNFHPGSHVGQGIKSGLAQTAALLNKVLSADQTTPFLLETMSGKGTEIGSTFEELAEIIHKTHHHHLVGVCLDTCHVFAAGYDIVHRLDDVLEQFDRTIGLERLKAVHLNDSLMPMGSHKDRHALIGKGTIGLPAFVKILQHPALRELPFFLETPTDDDGHKKEIALLKKQLNQSASFPSGT